MRILKRSGDRIDGDSLDAVFSVAGTVPLVDIKNFLYAAFTEMPEMMLAEDELLPLEEEFFRERYPRFRSLLLRENFPSKDVRLFRDQLVSFARLTEPSLTEMQKAFREAESLLSYRNSQLFDKYSRFYCDIAAAEPQAADLFFADFLETEIMAYDHEFDRTADPENPEDSQTLRDVCKRAEDFFKSENGRKFY